MPKLASWLLSVALLFAHMPAEAQGEAATALIDLCIDCHGTDGMALSPDTPHLDGQPEAVLLNMIASFRNGARPPKVRIHREIPTAHMTPLARHYSRQTAQRPKSATNPEMVSRGEAIYLKRCANCHVDKGRDSDKEAPLMAAQNLDYLVAQTLAFKAGGRSFPSDMDRAYRNLSDEDLAATAHFFAAQDPAIRKKRRRR